MEAKVSFITLAYLKYNSGIDPERLRHALEVLLPAIYPSDPYPAFVTKKPTGALGDKHLVISAPLNKATSDQLHASLERIFGQSFEISYVGENDKLNRTEALEEATRKVMSVYAPPSEVPFGPKTREEASVDAAQQQAELNRFHEQQESLQRQAEYESDRIKYDSGIYAD